jgi:hypothetical protein
MSDLDLAETRLFWAFYRMRGLNPIPSCPTEKKPLIRFADRYGWDTKLPDDTLEKHPTTNLQVMCGRPWGLLVIDLDGDEAARRFAERAGGLPRTWVSHSGGGGRHVWFTIEHEGPELPKAILWKGDGPHEAIERLGDRSLVIAPPSIHPKTGLRYEWLDRAHSPLGHGLGRPAPAPDWLLAWPPVDARPTLRVPPSVARITRQRPITIDARITPGVRADRNDVLAAIPDKIGLARSWGVRFAGRPTTRGYWPCHAIDRDDDRPSAAVRAHDGYYVDRGTDRRLTFFDLAIALGVYRDFREALDDLGSRYCGRRAG